MIRCLAGNRVGSGVLVLGRDWPPDVDGDTGVIAGNGARKRDLGAGIEASAALDVELSAANVELSSSDLLGRVEANVLHAEQVLAGRDASRQRHTDSSRALVVVERVSVPDDA